MRLPRRSGGRGRGGGRPGGATITGIVTDRATSRPVSGVQVYVYDATGNVAGSSGTDGAGSYAVAGLAGGSYRVQFRSSFGQAYADQYFRDATSLAGATAVAVAVGQTTSGIDAAMPGGGQIDGTVIDAVTHRGVQGIGVEVYAGRGVVVATTTAASGGYFVGGLIAGTYTVGFNPAGHNYFRQFFSGKATQADADPVNVADRQTTHGIDASLAPAGALSGRVTDTTGSAIAGALVVVYDSGGSELFARNTRPDGSYAVAGMAAGSYRIGFQDFAGGHLTSYYRAKPSLASSDAVVVTLGSTTTGIDAVLQTGASISGTVTDAATGLPLAGVMVDVFDANGNFVETSAGFATDAHGNYTLTGLPSGNFKVGFTPGSLNYLPQFYDAKPSLSAADTVAVTAGKTTPNVDAAMQPPGSRRADFALTVLARPLTMPEPGGTFTFTVRAMNRSASTPVQLTSVVDKTHGDLARRPGSTCAALVGARLAPRTSSAPCTFTVRFVGKAGATQTDAVTVTGANKGATVAATAKATVKITPMPFAAQVAPAALALGGVFHDTATLSPGSGAPAPAGRVVFSVFGPGDARCAGPVALSSTNALNPAGTTAVSGSFKPTRAGTYRVVSAYSGDATYARSTTACGDPKAAVEVGTAKLGSRHRSPLSPRRSEAPSATR